MTVFLIGAEVQPPADPLVAHVMQAASQRHEVVPVALLHSIYFNDLDTSRARRCLFDSPYIVGDALDPVSRSDAAANLLATWYKKYGGSWVHVLAAWRIGPKRVDNMLRGKTWQLTRVVHYYIGDVLAGAGMPRPITMSVNGTRQ